MSEEIRSKDEIEIHQEQETPKHIGTARVRRGEQWFKYSKETRRVTAVRPEEFEEGIPRLDSKGKLIPVKKIKADPNCYYRTAGSMKGAINRFAKLGFVVIR